jgi:sterol desaturase/sphingolipid hydroxylase (fatty acid hydroxylase superfamily)
MGIEVNIKTIITLTFAILLFVLEYFMPANQQVVAKIKHALNNLALSIISVLISFFATQILIKSFLTFNSDINYNLKAILHNYKISNIVSLITLLVLFDLWMYVWHRINHTFSFFWRFHKVHHTDLAMDVTTTLRFHPVEIILSILFRIPIFFVLGISFEELIIYETILQSVILFHHSNINILPKLDKILRVMLVSPLMHRIHHSKVWKETNSNYSSVLSLWDRLFSSYEYRKDDFKFIFGLNILREAKWQNITGLLLTPFRK